MTRGFRLKNGSVSSDIQWHLAQIRYDRTHYPPAVARQNAQWHRAQVRYDKRHR